MTQLEGMWVGNCHILRRIGGGGMGDVYLAEQPALGRNVAIKFVRAKEEHHEQPNAPAAMEDERARAEAQLAQEARAIAALDHPHILPLYEFGERDQLRYLVMPYVERGSLADLLRQGAPWGWTAPLAPTLAASIIEQTAGALQFAHDRHVIHRDVKPGNLLVRLLQRPLNLGDNAPSASQTKATPPYTLEPEDVHILLADFGLARFVGDSHVNTGARGTPLYSAPEQLQGQPSAASDQYALACVAYYLLTGLPVFTGSIAEICHQHLNVPPAPPSSLLPSLSPAMDAVILRALAKRPEERYPAVVAFAQALRMAIAAPLVSAAAPAPWTPPAPRRESALSKPRRDLQPAAASIPSRPAQASALSEATTQADGATDQIAGRIESRRARPSIPTRLSWQKAPPATPSPAPDDGRRPDGPAGRLPFSRRRGRARSLLAPVFAWRPPAGAGRPIMIGLVAVVLVSLLSGGGWLLTHRSGPTSSARNTAQAASITFLGNVSLASDVGVTHAPLVATLPVSGFTQRLDPHSVSDASLKSFARLPTLDAPARESATTMQPLASASGPEAALSAGHPWRISMDSDGQTTLVVSDGVLTVFHLSAAHKIDVRGMASARALFARGLAPTDALDQPQAIFDAVTKRWVLVMRQRVGDSSAPSGGSLDIAISATDDPLGAWNAYQLSATLQTLAPCAWADDPRIGVNAVSVSFTANLFACDAHRSYLGAGLWDISRASLFTGSRPQVYAFSGFTNSAGKSVLGVVPAVQRGDDATEWLLSDGASYASGDHPSSEIILWALEHPNGAAGTPALVGVVMQAPTSYADPPMMLAARGSPPLTLGDARPTEVIARPGSLYATFATAVHWSGDTLARPAIYWVIVSLPTSPNGKAPTSNQLSGAHVSSAVIWGAPGAAYIAPEETLAPDNSLTIAAVRVTADHPTDIVLATHAAGTTSAALGATTTLATDVGPLLWSGQGGTSLRAAWTSAAADQAQQAATPTRDVLWLASVIPTEGSRWHVQLWQTPAR